LLTESAAADLGVVEDLGSSAVGESSEERTDGVGRAGRARKLGAASASNLIITGFEVGTVLRAGVANPTLTSAELVVVTNLGPPIE